MILTIFDRIPSIPPAVERRAQRIGRTLPDPLIGVPWEMKTTLRDVAAHVYIYHFSDSPVLNEVPVFDMLRICGHPDKRKVHETLDWLIARAGEAAETEGNELEKRTWHGFGRFFEACKQVEFEYGKIDALAVQLSQAIGRELIRGKMREVEIFVETYIRHGPPQWMD